MSYQVVIRVKCDECGKGGRIAVGVVEICREAIYTILLNNGWWRKGNNFYCSKICRIKAIIKEKGRSLQEWQEFLRSAQEEEAQGG